MSDDNDRVRRVRRVQELRRSNATRPVPSGKRYTRKDKHRHRRGD